MTDTPVSPIDTAWMAICSALVMLMIPGLGLFYSGLSHHKHTLSIMISSFFTMSLVFLLWYLYGFSLAFSSSPSNPFIGNLHFFGLQNLTSQVYDSSIANLPLSVFVFYQGLFAALTPALAFGALAEKAHIHSWLVFVILWMTIVYCPITYWTWGTYGWARTFGVLDFAGGTPVHIASGFAGLALSIGIGRLKPRPSLPLNSSPLNDSVIEKGNDNINDNDSDNATSDLSPPPANILNVILGASLLWFGWFGFNGGSSYAINEHTCIVLIITHLAASVGGLFWTYLEYFHTKRISSVAFCTGVVTSLVGITPSAGFIDIWSTIPITLVTCLACFSFLRYIKPIIPINDSLDAFGLHGLGGFIGSVLTGVFANPIDAELPKGLIKGNIEQVGIQLSVAVASASWAFFITLFLTLSLEYVMQMRLSVEHDQQGDAIVMGEHPYAWILCSTPQKPPSDAPTERKRTASEFSDSNT